MDAIILCAGKSTRTYPLTMTRPKPLLRAANKTILEHNIQQLEGLVDKVVLVVGYKKEMIINFVENSLKNKYKIKIELVEQKKQLGTGHAVLQAEKHVGDHFIIMNGDDFYSKEDIKQIIGCDYALLAKEMDDCSRFGAVVVEGNRVKSIIEKPKERVSNISNIGLYKVKRSIFPIIQTLKKSERDEYEITDVIKELAKTEIVEYKLVKDCWLPITYAWNLLEANEFFLNRLKRSEIEGRVEERATIKGNIILGKGSVIKNGAYIEGPVAIGENSVIGPNCYIRAGTTIGDDCKIGNAVEIKNSIIGDHVNVCHLAYLGDSVLGDNINIGAGTIAANVRLDKKNIQVAVNGDLIDSGRKKLGVIMSDNTQTGINSSIMPGSTINPETHIYPSTVVGVDRGN